MCTARARHRSRFALILSRITGTPRSDVTAYAYDRPNPPKDRDSLILHLTTASLPCAAHFPILRSVFLHMLAFLHLHFNRFSCTHTCMSPIPHPLATPNNPRTIYIAPGCARLGSGFDLITLFLQLRPSPLELSIAIEQGR